MSWAPGRPDPAAMIDNYDTSETAGPTARFGHVEQVTAVFDVARAVDLARSARELAEARELPDMSHPDVRPLLPDADRHRREALITAQRAQAQLRVRGLAIDPRSGQVQRLAPPAAPPAAMGTMLAVDEEP
jgi:hypothetical protein